MKKIFFILMFLCGGFNHYVEAQTPIIPDILYRADIYILLNSSNSFIVSRTFYDETAPPINIFLLRELKGDTLSINLCYHFGPAWQTMFSNRYDTLNIGIIPSQINYIKIKLKANYVLDSNDIVPCKSDSGQSLDTLIAYNPTIETKLKLPNIITPNGDGINDCLKISGLSKSGNIMKIYNRWGNLIYSNNNYQNNWSGKTSNGKKVSDGTYYYILITKIGSIYKKSLAILR